MNFLEAKEYFEQLNKFGSVLGLDSIKELLRRLGNPERSLKVIHVAGTNGKGSTIAFIENILRAAGYRVGVYTSPVVFDYLEKIKINGEYISEEEFVVEAEIIKAANESIIADGLTNPTIFESETAMAYDYFSKKDCDAVIIETGMGGATDATNVCEKVLCSVITSISMDHTAFLGDTLEEIALVKAGIIKKNCPVAVMKQDKRVLDVVESVCNACGSLLSVTNSTENISFDLERTEFDYTSYTSSKSYKKLAINMLGTYQPDNAALAIEVVEILKRNCFEISDKYIEDGLLRTCWRGRFEKISEEPLMFMDGAHNPGASERLAETTEIYFRSKGYQIIYIFGVLADKDYSSIIRDLIKPGEKVFTITPHNARGLDGEILAETIRDVQNEGMAYADFTGMEKFKTDKSVKEFLSTVEFKEDYSEAVKAAVCEYKKAENSGNKAVILAFGSLSYLGELNKNLIFGS